MNDYPLSEAHINALSNYFQQKIEFKIKFKQHKNDDQFCVKIIPSEELSKSFEFKTSYFVGANWIIEDEFPIYIHPKFDSTDNKIEINYLSMLCAALSNTESIDHLDQLVYIEFDRKPIRIQQKEDLLSPLLIVQFLHLLKKIVRKGLKHYYYRVEKNLQSTVKGKVLVSKTIKKNHTKSDFLRNFCSYDQFGIDHTENRLLKKAFIFGLKHLSTLKRSQHDLGEIDNLVRYIRPAFQTVGDNIDVKTIKGFKPNPLFKDYSNALTLAKMILKRFGYNISNTEGKIVETPPYWIDMSKLFELHVLEQLKGCFPAAGEVMYQEKICGLFPDYLINSNEGTYKLIVDAKYKRYEFDQSIDIKDIRQIAAYSRMTAIYKLFDKNSNETISCLIIYPDLNTGNINLSKYNFESQFVPVKNYEGIYKLGINLPTI